MLAMARGEARLEAEDRIAEEENRWQNQALFGCEKVAKLFKVVTFANMLAFVYDGKYRTDGCSGCDWFTHSDSRNIPFDFMNQQLVFDELTSFVQFTVPLFRALATLPPLGWLMGSKKAAKASSNPKAAVQDTDSCMICGTDDPVMPHVGSCGHLGCYVCLMNGLLEDRACLCQRCGSKLEQLRPCSGPAGG